jgi:hypothetical protein
MHPTGWRATPARMLPAILAAVFATVLGWGTGGPAQPTGTAIGQQVATVAAHTGTAPADSGRLAPARKDSFAPAGAGAALAADSYRVGIRHHGTGAGSGAGRRPHAKSFSPVGSRAPPRTA